jgi:hypothetical protein
MRILGQKIFRGREKIGEITTPAPRNADFLACGFCVINDQNAPACVCCAHQTGRASPEDQCIYLHKRGLPELAVSCKAEISGTPVRQFS